jgi:PAS domain-containing protein
MKDPSHSTAFVVGIGVFADGLKELEDLVVALGDAAELAIVLLPQLDATTCSMLPDLLRRQSSLPIIEVTTIESLEAGCVYLCPVEALIELRGNVVVTRRINPDQAKSSLDHFFNALARELGERSAGVILSSSTDDGSTGLLALGAAGGLTFAVEADSDNARTTSTADYILPAEKIASIIAVHAALWKRIDRLQRELATTREHLEKASPSRSVRDAPSRNLWPASLEQEADRILLSDSASIATIVLDNDLHIRSFTPEAATLYVLSSADIGSPLQTTAHIAVDMPAFPKDFSCVTDWPIEDEVETLDGRWLLRRIQPYMDETNCPCGLVVTFYEFTEQHRLRMRLAAAHAVTKLLADADSFETVIPKVLNALRVSLSAEACLLWRVDNRGELLNCV